MAALLTPSLGEPDARELGNVPATRAAIFASVRDAATNFKPIVGQRYTLSLHDVDYDGPAQHSKAAEKQALLEGSTLARRLHGTWRLVDTPTGNVVDERRMTLANVPWMTPRGTFIFRGNDYSLARQMRLRPGIFTREKESGELESHVNVAKGRGHRYLLDPETGVFRLLIGQARLPLVSVLKALGATDKQLRDAWGNELFAANIRKDDPAALKKLYTKFYQTPMPNISQQEAIKQAFQKMVIDPKITQQTLGQPYERVDVETILAATAKLLRIHKGDDTPDDRDALAYQRTLGPEDIFAERIKRGAGAVRRMFWRAAVAGSLQRAQPRVFEKAMRGALLDTGLGNAVEEINPAELYDQLFRVTRMGEGGIPSLDAVPSESRNVQPSHLGFVDPTQTPESSRIGVDSRIAINTRRDKHGTLYSQFLDPKTNKLVWLSPQQLVNSVVAFPGELESGRPYVRAITRGKHAFHPRDEVDYQLKHMTETFGPLASMVPLKAAAFPQRVAMGSRMLTQALPLTSPEAPFVQSGIPGEDRSFEEKFGEHMGAVRSKVAGTVVDVSPGNIKIRDQQRHIHNIELYSNLPYNRKSVAGNTAIVIRSACGELWRGAIEDYKWHEGDRVLSVDPVTCQSAWKPVTAVQRHRNDKKLVHITTASGRSVTVTVDHSLVTIGDAGRLVPLYPRDCVINRTRLPVAMLPKHTTGMSMTYDEGLLAGLYIAEGHCPLSQPGLVILAVEPDDRAETVLSLCARLGLHAYRTGGRVCFTDHTRCKWLVESFGHLSHNKRLPVELLTLPTEFCEGVICGYFAGDGNLHADTHGAIQLTAVTTSRRLRGGLIDLLSAFGIFCTLFDAPRVHLNKEWRDAYGLRVINSHIMRLDRWFLYDDREELLRHLLADTQRASQFDIVPIPATRAGRKALYNGYDEVSDYIYKTANEGAVARNRLPAQGPYAAWQKSDVMWDKVVAITPGPTTTEHVYDLCVEDSEMFAVCHGLIVHNTFIHNMPAVGVGDRVAAGQLLAYSNFTDKNGTAALGKNARVAYLPYKGWNYEDAIVISESFAKRAASEHMYQNDLELDDATKASKNAFIAAYPSKYSRQLLDKYDSDGVIKPGKTVSADEPLILAIRERRTGPRVGRRQRSYADASITWDHHADGVVTDVHKGKAGINVVVKAIQPTQVGDKFSGRFGDKGIVAEIVPDSRMPRSRDGRPFEVLLNPLGVISRGNPAQVIEAALGKIVEKTGQPYRLPDFESEKSLTKYALAELRRHGLTSTETIVDPDTDRAIEGINTGNRFLMKLHHTAEAKAQGRATGGYTAEGAPAKGGTTGSKRVGLLELNALLSHGAYQTIRDAGLVRGQKNEDYWRQVMSGYTPPTPKVPFVYEKFVESLRAAGINPVKEGTKINIMALTADDVKTLAGDRMLRNADTVDWRVDRLTPVRGGLFDESLTGGHGGKRWAYIKLHESLPHPVMEEPIRYLLGLTKARYEKILAGKGAYGPNPLAIDDKRSTGPQALYSALEGMNLDNEIARARMEIKAGRKTHRDKAIRRLRYLEAAKRAGQHPKDWFMDRVPVLPPAYRPVSVLQQTGSPLVADANYLYKELFDANSILKDMSGAVDDVSDERLALYRAFRGVVGLGDPITPKSQDRGVRGILKQIFGSSPKFGLVQRKLLGSTVDLVGRGTIKPNPDLDMDQVGLPEEKAWVLYRPFIVRRLVRRGMPKMQALRAVKDQTERAKRELMAEMAHRPVIITRAPVLHRYGVMAAWPQLTSSQVLEIPPLLTGGFGADFDGDAMQYHLPSSSEAVNEAKEKLLPSQNLLSVSKFEAHYVPTQEYVGGLWAASTRKDAKTGIKVFQTPADAIKAYRRGDIGVGQRVEIVETGKSV